MIDPNYAIWHSEPATDARTQPPLGEALSLAASRYPDREAVVYTRQQKIPETRWTYRQLNERAETLARNLLSRDYQPGDAVAIWGPNHPEWVLLEYALAKAGLILVALNPLYKADELRYALNASEVTALFHADVVGETKLFDVIAAVKPDVPTLRDVFSFSDGIDALIAQGPSADALPMVRGDDIMMIQYTSGTTGKPKAAQLSHAAIAVTAQRSYHRWGFGDGSRVCHGFPLFHVGGSGNSIPGACLNGATTYPLYIFNAEETLNILEQERCDGFIGVPTMVIDMLNHPSFAGRDLATLKRLVLGGAQVPAALIRRCEDELGVDVLNCYGQTETCGVSTSTLIDDSAQLKSRTSGQALTGVSLKIADADGNPLPHDQPGELCYKGPGCMTGYRDPAANAEAFDADGWLRSGDRASMSASGYISIVGRAKEMIIRGGENLSPAEIEGYMLEHPDIDNVAVVGLPDERYGEEVCAAVKLKANAKCSAEEIRSWCSEKVSKWKVPRYVALVADFPTTHSGKIKKYLLQQQMIEHFQLAEPAPQGEPGNASPLSRRTP